MYSSSDCNDTDSDGDISVPMSPGVKVSIKINKASDNIKLQKLRQDIIQKEFDLATLGEEKINHDFTKKQTSQHSKRLGTSIENLEDYNRELTNLLSQDIVSLVENCRTAQAVHVVHKVLEIGRIIDRGSFIYTNLAKNLLEIAVKKNNGIFIDTMLCINVPVDEVIMELKEPIHIMSLCARITDFSTLSEDSYMVAREHMTQFKFTVETTDVTFVSNFSNDETSEEIYKNVARTLGRTPTDLLLIFSDGTIIPSEYIPIKNPLRVLTKEI